MKPGRFSLKSRRNSFRYAFRGIAELFRTEPNALIHLTAAIVVVTAGILLDITTIEWCIITIVTGLVFVAEIFNTSLEAISDIIDPDWNEKIMKAKDLAAGGVLVTAIVSLIAGALIFIPRIIGLF